MKGRLLVIAFGAVSVVAGALTFEPSATVASSGAKPSATPRKVKKPRTTNVWEHSNIPPSSIRSSTRTGSHASSKRKRHKRKHARYHPRTNTGVKPK